MEDREKQSDRRRSLPPKRRVRLSISEPSVAPACRNGLARPGCARRAQPGDEERHGEELGDQGSGLLHPGLVDGTAEVRLDLGKTRPPGPRAPAVHGAQPPRQPHHDEGRGAAQHHRQARVRREAPCEPAAGEQVLRSPLLRVEQQLRGQEGDELDHDARRAADGDGEDELDLEEFSRHHILANASLELWVDALQGFVRSSPEIAQRTIEAEIPLRSIVGTTP
mmetsp:Transcript_17391/g.48002  ORF Transcript_17391/g.48002 Transcript_17391/m.48002 type:complete len:223 (+) Transcript_17391:69-737(+)